MTMMSLFTAVLLQAGSPVPAVTPYTEQQIAQLRLVFEQINSSAPPPDRETITSSVLESEQSHASHTNSCSPTSLAMRELQPTTGVPIILQGIVQGPLKNGWRATFDVEGCGEYPSLIYAIVQTKAGELMFPRVGTGATLTNANIMRDARTNIVALSTIALNRAGVDCDVGDFTFGIMRVTDRSDDLGESIAGMRLTGNWSEEWLVTGCGSVLRVPVTFTADGAGGAYIRVRSEEMVIEDEQSSPINE